MNNVILRGYIRNIEHSHTIDGVDFDKADMVCKRMDGSEDILNLKFKAFSNRYKDNDYVELAGNLRSYSFKVDEEHNKVVVYVFTYFDEPDQLTIDNNIVDIDGRICKLNNLRTTQHGKNNVHFILANNITNANGSKRLNSYIPCIAWGNLSKEISQLSVGSIIKVHGELHSREHKKLHPNGEFEIRVAHELVVKSFEVVQK